MEDKQMIRDNDYSLANILNINKQLDKARNKKQLKKELKENLIEAFTDKDKLSLHVAASDPAISATIEQCRNVMFRHEIVDFMIDTMYKDIFQTRFSTI